MSEKLQTRKKDKQKFIILVGIICLLLIATIALFPYARELMVEENRQQLIDYIRSKGMIGVLILLALQLLQVVVAFIPGEIVEVASGVLYGTFGGYLVCTVGVLLSSAIIFFTVRKLGRSFVVNVISEEKLEKMKWLQDVQKLKMIVFILFFIPGTPKDMLTYIVPLTPMKPKSFFLISTVARIPSIISSTYAGATIEDGDFGKTILVFAITGILGILGIVFNDKILHSLRCREKGK